MKRTTHAGTGRIDKTPQGKSAVKDGERHFKTGGADLRTKVNVIKTNAHKYPISAMCCGLQVNRSTYYYETKQPPDESGLASEIKEIFRPSRNNYGTRKIKKELMKTGKQVSRRRIGRIMKQEGLVSNYTTAQFKPQKDACNESKTGNILNRQFDGQGYRDVVISDLTYARVGMRWNYICVLVVCILNRLSRSVPDTIGLVRQLKDSGTEVYAPDRNMMEIMEKIMETVLGIST